MAEQTAEDRYIECGRPCKPGHTLQWDQCRQAPDPLGELGPAIRAARNVISEWETFTASDGNLSIRQKEDRSSDEIAREVVEVVGPLLAAIEEPTPDWADVREAARKAGWTYRRLARNWHVWAGEDGSVHVRRRWGVRGWKITLAGEFGDLVLNQPTAARFAAIVRLVGIGGDRG